jgi:tripartite-type tricarboxylate transporter receptor subunit TctC
MNRFIGLFVIALIATSVPKAPAVAQSWPTRPLTLVVPFAAGGPSDVAGRIIAQRMSELLGQQVIVENPSGAGGTLGSSRVAKAAPDGYQFVIGPATTVGASRAEQTITRQPALGPSPQPRPAPTARALPPEPVAQEGQNWTPIGGQIWKPIDTRLFSFGPT